MAHRFVKLLAVAAIAGAAGCEKDPGRTKRVDAPSHPVTAPPAPVPRPGMTVAPMRPRVLPDGSPAPGNVTGRAARMELR